MSSRGRSPSPRPLRDGDVDMETESIRNGDKPAARVVIATNLTRNVVEAHIRTIFGFYGEIAKIDLPLFGKSGQNRGKVAVEYVDSASAHKAASHMNGGQLDGSVLKVELSDLPIRSRSRSPRARGFRNGRDRRRSASRSRTRTPSPLPLRRRSSYRADPRVVDSYRRGPPYARRGPPRGDTYRPISRSRSRSPIRRGPPDRPPLRRRSPSYERGGMGFARGRRSRSRSYSVRSSRSRSPSYSRSRTRSPSYSSYSRYSRSRSRSVSKARRSYSRDDIRDSRSRSP